MNANESAKAEELKADVVVIGGGGAGLAAAVAASERGGRVILLEKRGLGGTSARAFGIFAAESPVQKRENVDCSKEECFKIAMDFAHWRINPRIVRAFIEKSGDTVRWLQEKGLEFECGPFGPDQMPTFHIPKGRGAAIIKTLAQECRDLGVPLHIRTPAKRIIKDAKGNITGVLAETEGEEFTVAARSVIIATGGYGGNKRLLRKYCPYYHDNMERIGLPHKGDGLVMASRIGAANEGLGILILGMPSALHPPDLVVRADSPPDLLRIGLISIASEPRAILVNKFGKRFVNENAGLGTTNCMVRQPDNVCYTLWDSQITQAIAREGPTRAINLPKGEHGYKLPGLVKDLEVQADKGLVRISYSWDEVADWMGANRGVLKATIEEYNADCDQGYDTVFAKDKKYLIPLSTPPYYAIKWGVSFLNTIGGIKINERTEVLDRQNNPIPGLYAAGVDTGGWETETYCMKLPGHAFGFALNSGRIAGENAAEFALGSN